MTTSQQNPSEATHAARAITLFRARYLSSKFTDDNALESWEDASALYYNLTGRDHPMARYASFEE